MHIHLYVCLYTCVWRPEVDNRCFAQLFYTLFDFVLRQGFLLNLKCTDSLELAGQAPTGSLLPLPPYILGVGIHTSDFCWRLEFVLHSRSFMDWTIFPTPYSYKPWARYTFSSALKDSFKNHVSPRLETARSMYRQPTVLWNPVNSSRAFVTARALGTVPMWALMGIFIYFE